uniref:DUF2958 domain-containing protein n=1 Tax=Steinernema glaseri TaxID=37863 RepID=A0A1I7YNN8_9BILA
MNYNYDDHRRASATRPVDWSDEIDWKGTTVFAVRLAIVVIAVAVLYVLIKPKPYVACSCRIGQRSAYERVKGSENEPDIMYFSFNASKNGSTQEFRCDICTDWGYLGMYFSFNASKNTGVAVRHLHRLGILRSDDTQDTRNLLGSGGLVHPILDL